MELRPEQKKSAAKKGGGLAAMLKGEKKEEKKEQTPEELKAEIADLKKQLANQAGSNEDLNTKPILGYWKIRGLGA